jgi:hypothetical protein
MCPFLRQTTEATQTSVEPRNLAPSMSQHSNAPLIPTRVQKRDEFVWRPFLCSGRSWCRSQKSPSKKRFPTCNGIFSDTQRPMNIKHCKILRPTQTNPRTRAIQNDVRVGTAAASTRPRAIDPTDHVHRRPKTTTTVFAPLATPYKCLHR